MAESAHTAPQMPRLVHCPQMFEHAVQQLDALFPSAWPRQTNSSESEPSDSEATHSPNILSDPDHVVHRVLCAVDALRVGEGSPARQICLFKGEVIASLDFDAARSFEESSWARIEASIAGGQPTAAEDQSLLQVLTRHRDVRLFALCSTDQAMFFYRPPAHPGTLVCSQVYPNRGVFQDQDPESSTTRYVLVAAVLAALSDLGIFRTSVVFGPIEGSLDSAHPLDFPDTTISAVDIPHTKTELYDAESVQSIPFEKRDAISILWKPFYKPLHEAYLRIPDTFLEKGIAAALYRYVPEDTEIPLAEGAGPDITVDERISERDDGHVFRGSLANGRRVILKVTDVRVYQRGPGWQASIIETLHIRALLAAGLAPYMPQLLGLWQGAEMTFFVTTDVGAAFKEWNELSDSQWEQFCAALRAFHRAGFHHGDLFPRNVCCDEAGTVRLIDFACAIKCRCKEQCIDITDLDEDSEGRPFLHG